MKQGAIITSLALGIMGLLVTFFSWSSSKWVSGVDKTLEVHTLAIAEELATQRVTTQVLSELLRRTERIENKIDTNAVAAVRADKDARGRDER